MFDLADEQWIRKISDRTLKRIPDNFNSRAHLTPAELRSLKATAAPTKEEIGIVSQELLDESARRRGVAP